MAVHWLTIARRSFCFSVCQSWEGSYLLSVFSMIFFIRFDAIFFRKSCYCELAAPSLSSIRLIWSWSERLVADPVRLFILDEDFNGLA